MPAPKNWERIRVSVMVGELAYLSRLVLTLHRFLANPILRFVGHRGVPTLQTYFLGGSNPTAIHWMLYS